MRSAIYALMALSLAACGTAVPDSGAGVGFNDYNQYQEPIPSPMQTTATPAAPGTGFSTDGALAAIDRASGATPAATAPTSPYPVAPYTPTQPMPGAIIGQTPAATDGLSGSTPAGIKQETGELVHQSAGISDEQDFEAVKSRETIESDKARIERNKSQYTVDQPGALPQRTTGDNTALIIQFALATSHPVGTQMYNRSGLGLGNSEKACAKYGSPDKAQEAFLQAGGPDRDRKGLDPDGDGYACGWNPAPFRAAIQ